MNVDEAVEPVKSPAEELLALLARGARRLPIAVFLVLALVASLIYPHSSHYEWALWLLAVVSVLVLRFVVLTRLPAMTDWSLEARVNVAAALSGVNGVTHAACLLFFPVLSDIERAIVSMVLSGLGTAAIATTAGDRRVYLAYFVPIFAPLVALWASRGSLSVPTVTEAGLAMAIVIFAAVLLMLARDTHQQFLQSIHIRKQQEALNRQLQKALSDADVADRAKTRFLASASHDLRQPIHALSLFGAALKMQVLPDHVRELANNIDESISVLATQLDALLDISRLDAGVVKPEIAIVDLTGMLRRVARDYEAQTTDKGLALATELIPDVRVSTDPLLIERVVRNLLSNAIRYTETGGIAIRMQIEGDACKISVTDTGIGIPIEEQENIFGEFYQVSETGHTSARQGLGLGLSIVRRLLSLLDAPIVLKSVPGEGTCVEISLLREERNLDKDVVEKSVRLEGLNVLVIDDDLAVRRAMAALLGSFGAHITTASNIDEALQCVASDAPDVVLSDLRLGAEDGVEAIERIRALCVDLPAILITGDTSAEQIRLAEDSGFELLHKPVSAADLEKRVADAVFKRS